MTFQWKMVYLARKRLVLRKEVDRDLDPQLFQDQLPKMDNLLD